MKRIRITELVFIIILIILLISGNTIVKVFTNYTIDKSFKQYKEQVQNNKYIAHALGGIEGNTYTNSKEAMETSYDNGYKLFEVDVNLTSDEKLVCVHGWEKEDYTERIGVEYDEKNPVMSYKDFMKIKIQGKYSPLDFNMIIDFMKDKKDIYVMIDIGSRSYEETKKIYEKIVKLSGNEENVLQRFIVGGHTTDMINAVKATYDFKLINLYFASDSKREKSIFTEEEFTKYCIDNDISSISIAFKNYSSDLGKYMHKNGILVYVFTLDNEKQALKVFDSADIIGTNFLIN